MRNKKDRKVEIRKLESSLEQLLVNLGLAPTTTQSSSEETESEEEVEEIKVVVEEPPKPVIPEPVKRH